ncbi:ankyrin repeat domain-containing protein [Marinobacter sp. HN1S83]|uniref:ankyrin repeat domain-containing protein n=1 Tax=Marinobacter sp. HN1S83 TaxID=3382301 RepID=UPI00387ABAF8
MAPYEMARNGQLEDLKLWVSLQGDNVDVADSRWDSFARTAAERGHLDILEYLNTIGIELEKYDKFGNTPLHSASFANEIGIIHWLLKLGFAADTQKSVNHRTALIKAARHGSAEAVTTLLEAGADPLVNSRGGTAFELAENLDVLYVLMNHWAEQGDGMPPPGISAASWWSFMKQPDHVPERLLRQDLGESGCHALHWAAVTGHLRTLRWVLDRAPQAALSSKCLDSFTPLGMAIRFNRPEVVAELLNRWQEVEVSDVRLAVKYGSATLARTLYDALPTQSEALELYPRTGSAVFENYVREDLEYLIGNRVISPIWALDTIARRGDELLHLAPLVAGQGVPLMRFLRYGLRLENDPLVEWVLSLNPPLPQWNDVDHSPFIVAAEAGATGLAKRLWQPDAVFGEDNYYERLEYFAAAGWTEKVLSYTHRRSDLLSYALWASARHGNVSSISDLVKAGARASGRHCSRVFSAAIDAGTQETVELLAETHSDNTGCLTNALVDVVDEGKVALLSPLLENGADPNGEGDGYSNAVVKAVRAERLVILVELLKAGADPSVVDDPEGTILELAQSTLTHSEGNQGELQEKDSMSDKNDLTPLMQAVNSGDLEEVKVLLAEGADITETNKEGETAAHIAIRAGQADAASLLLSFDVLLKKDDRGRTPFHLIGAYGSKELATHAMKLSKGVYAKDEHGKYPLDYAARLNEPVALQMVKATAQHTDNLPKLAASYGHQNLMDYLSQRYQAQNGRDYQGKPEAGYFLVAVARDDREWWESLLENSLQPEDAFLGEPLLYMAARYNNLSAFKRLVKDGAGLSDDFFRIEPSAPYRYALRVDEEGLAETLLDSLGWGEKDEFLVSALESLGGVLSEDELVTWLENDGEDVLDESLARTLNGMVRHGRQLDLLDALVRAGADLHEADYSGQSAAQLAKETLKKDDIGWQHRLSLVALLTKADDAPSAPVWEFLHYGLDALTGLETQVLNSRDDLSRLTLLDVAVFRGDIEAVRYLLQNGADVATSTMHILALTGQVMILDELAPQIYDLNARDFVGNTPLMTAVTADQREMVEALLAMGARTNVYNAEYRYPLKLAVLNRAEPVVKVLLDHGAHPDGFSEQMASNALTSAVVNSDLATTKTLVEAGASENPLLGPPPYSVLAYAYRNGGADILDYLGQVFPRTETERESDLDLAWRFNSEPGIKHLLEQGVSL